MRLDSHCINNTSTSKFAVGTTGNPVKTPYICYLNFINDLIRHVSLQIQFMHDHCTVQTFNLMPYFCQKKLIRYYETVYERAGINHFWSMKIPLKF